MGPASEIETRLARELSRVPVTGLAFYSSPEGVLFVLAAEDTDLKVYEAESRRLVSQFRIFDEQPIHGIHVQQEPLDYSRKALAWGSRYVAVFQVDGIEEGRRPSVTRIRAPDWIYDGRLSPFDPSVAVLATAHNEVVRLRHDTVNGKLFVQDIVSPARPILYSADLAWIGDHCVLMAAGTAFGEILIWKCWFTVDQKASHEMLFVLNGHEGSIYGVGISPPLSLPDGTSVRLLASCSDDRTVRIWDITERMGNNQTYDQGHFSAPRETGFSEILPDQEQPSMDAVPPVAVAMGHLSRIWGVEFTLPDHGTLCDSGLNVYSFGEDSTTQKWHLTITTAHGPDDKVLVPLTGKLTLEQVFSLHEGKHLWSHSTSSLGRQRLLATGGADSRISLIEEHHTTPASPLSSSSDLVSYEVRNLCRASAPLLVKSKMLEIAGRFEFITQDELVMVTSHGRLLLGSFREDNLQWKQLHADEEYEQDLKRCYAMKKTSHGAVVIGTTTGNVYLYNLQTDRLSHAINIPGKIVHISCLGREERAIRPGDTLSGILVDTFGTAEPRYLLLNPSTGIVQDEFQISGVNSRFVTNSAARIGDYLIMGSRHGYLSVLRKDGHEFTQILGLRPYSPDSVSSITPLPGTSEPHSPTSSETTRFLFLTTSRDGKYRIHQLEDRIQSPQIQLRHESGLPFGPIVEGAWFTNDPSPELVLYGFRSKSLVVWNETRREERLSCECGGAHRAFSFRHGDSDSDPIRFAFTHKSSNLSIYSQTRRPCSRPLKSGTHGREIRAISCNGRYIATGAEDTSVRIWEYQNPSAQSERHLRCLTSMKSHVSGIQTLKWVGDDYLFSSGGNEELFTWRVQSLDSKYTGLGVVREAVFDDKSPDGDLRIMDFDAQRDERNGEIIITLVFSNSALRTYRYRQGQGFQVLVKGSYTGACLTQTRHLGPWGEGWTILTTSTDGHISLWGTRVDEEQEAVYTIDQVVRVHQSSIKCLDMVTAGHRRYVLTGGDDNALGITVLTSDPDASGFTISTRGILRKAHAAAVNGVIAAQRGRHITAVTVSNDQRIKTWRMMQDQPQSIELSENVYSGVADPGDVELLDGGSRAIVGGVGVEVWNLDGSISRI